MLSLAPRQLATLLVRALGDVPGHEFHGNQWTDEHSDIPREDAQQLIKDILDKIGGVARADAISYSYGFSEGMRHRMIESFKPELPKVHAMLEAILGKEFNIYRAQSGKDESKGVRSFSLSADAAREFLGPSYKTKSDVLQVARISAKDVVAVASHYSAEVLVDTAKVKLKSLGDVTGHAFHGNQWTHGVGGNEWRKIDRHEGQVLNNVAMHTVHEPDFSQSVNPAIHEPELVVPKGKHASAGVVMTEPDGRVWVVEPHNRYGGYRNTFPKGTVDKGESLQETAAREVWEETGLVTKITGHLVDVERTTSVARFYTGVRVGGAPWAAGKETHAVKLMPVHGKGAENNLKNVFSRETSDRKVLDALRGHLKQKTLSVRTLGDVPGHEFHGNQYTGGWPEGLKNISGAKGSNPGGLYVDKHGQKWYVKRYNNPQQAQTEHIANAVYRAVGVETPQSVLGEGGDYASKVIAGEGTLAKVGLTKDRANKILDGFAADVFLDNWDAVGTDHDNILISGDRAIRIDQGGTLTFRAQGAPKPEAGLEKIGEWESLVNQNHYYNAIFKAAGVKNGDALGERAAKQIDKIVAARPKGGWKELIDKVAPKADASFRAKAARMLEARQKLLEQKRDQLRIKAAEWNEALHPRNPAGGPDGGEFTSTGGSKIKGKKAPKAPPVSIEAKKAAYAEVKAGGTFKNTAAKYGMTQGQLAGHVWKVDQAKKKAEEALEEEAALKSVVKSKPVAPTPAPPPTPSGKYWVQMTQDEKLAYAHKEGLQWLPKANSQHGNYAWFNAQGQQVSGYGPKEGYRDKLDTINQGKGLGPEKPPTLDVHAEFGVWPIAPDIERSLSSKYQNKMLDHHMAWSNKLTSNEVDAIHSYTASGYSELNSNLRMDVALQGHQAYTNAGLNTALNKAPSPPPPELVWRGISSQTVAAKFAGLSVGDSFQMGGFQSTSISPKFAHSWGSGGTLFEIKPSKGAYVKLRSSHPSEQEYLLPHNAKYTVRGVAHIKMQDVSGKVRVLQLEMH